MSAKVISDLPADQMADIIRQSIRQRLEKGTGTDSLKARPTEPANVAANVPLLQIKPSYTIADFLKFHDEAFVVNAYVGLLQRKPDDKSRLKWLKKLREGTPRLEMLRELRFSPEGEGRNVRVLGLSFPDSAAVLSTRRQLLEQQVKSVWTKKHRRLKNEIRSLKQRVLDLERQVIPVEAPAGSAEKMEGLLRAWEVRLNSQGERIARAMAKLQDRLEDAPEAPAEVGFRAVRERRSFGP